MVNMLKGNIKNKLENFLKKMNLKYFYDEDKGVFAVPFEIRGERVMISIIPGEKWIYVGSAIVNVKNLPPEVDREKLFALLLRETLYIPEVTYGLTDQGDIVAHAETATKAFEYKNFEIEFFSVVYGVQHFLENIATKFPIKTESRVLYI